MAVQAYIDHALRGRIRIKIPQKKQDPDFLDHCAQVLCEHPEIFKVKTSVLTGSLLIYCEPALSSHQIKTYCEASQLLQLQIAAPPNKTIGQQMTQQINEFDTKLQQLSEGEVDVKSAIFIAFMVMAVLQFFSGQRLAPATTLMWYALQALTMWNGNKKL